VPDLDRRLAALPETPGPAPRVWAACAAHLASRHELNRRFAGEIAAATGLPLAELPLLPGGVRGPDDLAVLARSLFSGEGS
jgi:hypothetical protein